MQFLDDDSNEWMRKAAADYPVKPIGMNWEAVARQLPEEEHLKDNAGGYALMRYAAMVVFFMLLSLVCNKYLRLDFNNRYAAVRTSAKKQQQAETPATSSVTKSAAEANRLIIERGAQDVPLVYPAALEEPRQDKVTAGNDAEVQMVRSANGQRTLRAAVSPLERKKPAAGELSLPEWLVNALVTKASQRGEDANEAPQELDANKDWSTKRKRLYAGLMAGPDISTVKLQQSAGLGVNLGFFVGYRLSPRWQLESGVLFNRKEYFSGGEYFNAGRMYLPTHAYITKVDGYCTMFEIPLNVRYNFRNKGQAHWFATAGVSSYLMNKEDYNYTYKRYNVEYESNKVYKGLSQEWLTAVNASIGYEKAVSEKVQIRLEPYLKLPLRGMGTGKLPISSAGMNVGISYPIK